MLTAYYILVMPGSDASARSGNCRILYLHLDCMELTDSNIKMGGLAVESQLPVQKRYRQIVALCNVQEMIAYMKWYLPHKSSVSIKIATIRLCQNNYSRDLCYNYHYQYGDFAYQAIWTSR